MLSLILWGIQLMSARNMVRNLRDSGLLTAPRAQPWRGPLLLIAALLFGAVLYLGGAYAMPGLMRAMEKKPPPISYAKPLGDIEVVDVP